MTRLPWNVVLPMPDGGGRAASVAHRFGPDVCAPGELGPELPPRYGSVTNAVYNEESLVRRGWAPDAAAAAVGVNAWGARWAGSRV
jgi:hypothetical protein